MIKLKMMLSLVLVTLMSAVWIGDEVNADNEDVGKVYFLRSTGFAGSAAGFNMFIDDAFVCKLNNKSYSIHEVPVGTHYISVQFGGKKSKEKAEKLEINVEKDKATYVQVVFETGALVNNVLCEEMLEKSAIEKMEKLKEDTKCL